jgi:hypothetical protein
METNFAFEMLCSSVSFRIMDDGQSPKTHYPEIMWLHKTPYSVPFHEYELGSELTDIIAESLETNIIYRNLFMELLFWYYFIIFINKIFYHFEANLH